MAVERQEQVEIPSRCAATGSHCSGGVHTWHLGGLGQGVKV